MTTTLSPLRATCARLSVVRRWVLAALALLAFAAGGAAADEAPASAPLKIAVYDVPPYGIVEADGSIDGVSVDLWRRAAEVIGRQYRPVPVPQMEAILQGLERNEFDAAIGADRLLLSDASLGRRRRGPRG